MAQDIEKKSVDTDPSVSSKLNESSSCIEVRVSPDMKIEFFLHAETVQARVSVSGVVDEQVVVKLPEISSQYNPKSVTTYVKQLLRNCHLRPMYQSQPQKEVYFQAVPFEQKTWKKQSNILNLPDHSVGIEYVPVI
ncbi:unnamed protein product [Adineta steineri]|uniref:Uncharacterized protein n=1 Tax=Adineta steineri TaxID=433720 RepID=A0A813USZ8_9BILA|nr:unnamed protein product [Adineta steineri]